jgi:hypothetical protein
VSVFGHVWFDPNVEGYDSAPWSGLGKISMDANSVNILREQYPGIVLEVETPRSFDISEITRLLPEVGDAQVPDFERRRDNLHNTASHCYSIHRALALANEAHRNNNFDFYVLSRYDTVLSFFPSVKALARGGLYLSDHQIWSSRANRAL